MATPIPPDGQFGGSLLAPDGSSPAPPPAPFGPRQVAGGITGARSLRRMARAITANRKATAGAVLLAIFTFLALFPGLIAHDDPNADDLPA